MSLGNVLVRKVSTASQLLRFNMLSAIESVRIALDRKSLNHFEKQIYSQNGEDGIIEESFRRIGAKSKYFVEIGVGYGQRGMECNTRSLLQDKGWRGVWIDGAPKTITQAKVEFAKLPIQLVEAFVSKDNIASLFQKAGVPQDLDLLSIDVDGNDYFLWEAVASFRARVVIMEYNSRKGPDEDWTMPYRADHVWDGVTDHYGASLTALTRLADSLGYRLVGCDRWGANAFFILKTEDLSAFSNTNCPPKFHYRIGKYNYPQTGWWKAEEVPDYLLHRLVAPNPPSAPHPHPGESPSARLGDQLMT